MSYYHIPIIFFHFTYNEMKLINLLVLLAQLLVQMIMMYCKAP